MQILFTNIHYDDKYIYALGRNLLNNDTRKIKISRKSDQDFICENGYDTVFFRGAVCLMGDLYKTGKLPKKKTYMWEH